MFEWLQGKEIVVAGGTGGLGSVLCGVLAKEGARLAIGYRENTARAEAVSKYGTLVKGDLTQAADRKRLLDSVGSLYGLVVLAGIPARAGNPADLDQTMRTAMEVNYQGPVLLAREAADRMKAANAGGSIVLVASMQTADLFPGSTAYAASKAALLYAARILAKECRGPANVRVNVVSPGVTSAGMAEASVSTGKYEKYLTEGAIHRYGRAADVARAVRFFLEPDNYVTGQVLVVDGGLTL